MPTNEQKEHEHNPEKREDVPLEKGVSPEERTQANVPHQPAIRTAERTFISRKSGLESLLRFSKGKPARTKKPVAPPPAFENLCKGMNDKQRRENAAKVDAMWNYVKSKNSEPNYRTACAAVYKLTEWLGMVHKGTKASIWMATLQEHYGVSVTEAISKYKILKPPTSRVFRQAVLDAFAYAEKHMALSAKRNPLPPIYR